MAQWALHLTPCVTLEAQRDVLLLEVKASLRLWGGRESVLDRLRQGWATMGWLPPDHITMACADTPRAAHWQAFYAASEFACPPEHFNGIALERLPLYVVEEAQAHLSILQRMGIHTIGQLERLPRQGITRRFGKTLLHALDTARGVAPDPRQWITVRDTFQAQLELPARADHSGLIEQGAARLFNELQAWLAARQAGIRNLNLVLQHDDPPHTPLMLGFASVTRDAERFKRLLSERLTRFQLPRPVYALQLHVSKSELFTGAIHDLFDAPTHEKNSLPQLIERLQTRLGPAQVQQLKLSNDHRPEAAMATAVFDPPASVSTSLRGRRQHLPLPAEINQPLAHSHRPSWLLKEPLILTTQSDRPIYHGPLRLICGPERIEAGWWENQQKAAARRDYFIAASQESELLWIFRTPQHQWYLHGFFS